jgi:hypothetical protein
VSAEARTFGLVVIVLLTPLAVALTYEASPFALQQRIQRLECQVRDLTTRFHQGPVSSTRR